MAEITLEQIKQLRVATGAGVTAVKEALEKSNGDVDEAITYLRERGIAKAAKRADKTITNGYIGHYIHNNGRVAVLIELGSETDFAANSDNFRKFADRVALHVAASNPTYVSRDRVPADLLEKEEHIYRTEVEGKPEEVANKIVEGKINKFFEENVLLDQVLFDGNGETVQDALNELIAAIGERIVIGKMVKLHISGVTTVDLGN